jgi:hypothetical protein
MIGNLSIFNSNKVLYKPYPTVSRADLLFITPTWKTFTSLTASDLDITNVFRIENIFDVQQVEGKNELIKSPLGYSYSNTTTKEIYTIKCHLLQASYEKVLRLLFKQFRVLVYDKNKQIYAITTDPYFKGVNCEIIRIYKPNLISGNEVGFVEIDIQINEGFNYSTTVNGLLDYNWAEATYNEINVEVYYVVDEGGDRILDEEGKYLIYE